MVQWYSSWPSIHQVLGSVLSIRSGRKDWNSFGVGAILKVSWPSQLFCPSVFCCEVTHTEKSLLDLDCPVCRAVKECILYKLPGVIATTTKQNKKQAMDKYRFSMWQIKQTLLVAVKDREAGEVLWMAIKSGQRVSARGHGMRMSCVIPLVFEFMKDSDRLKIDFSVSLPLSWQGLILQLRLSRNLLCR